MPQSPPPQRPSRHPWFGRILAGAAIVALCLGAKGITETHQPATHPAVQSTRR